MKLRFIIILSLVVILSLPAILYCAKFKYGFLNSKTDEVTLQIPRPPDALISKKNVQVVVAEVPPSFGNSSRLRLAVEQALTPDFSMVGSQPDALFKISVVTYDRPIARRYTQTENRMIKVGQKPVKNRDGSPKLDGKGNQIYEDDIQSRPVPVEYWEASAHMLWRVEVADPSGITIDGFTPQYQYQQKKEISVNNVSLLGSQSLPDERGIQTAMIEQTAHQFVRRYRKTYESAKVLLAVDDELRPANQKAIAGDWEGALRDWESVKMKKANTEGDRVYNIAVAHEALAFRAYAESGNPEDAEPLFLEALQGYQKAMSLDPTEKYIQRASQRIEMAKSNLENAKKQWAAQRFEAEKLMAENTAQRQAEEADRLAAKAREGEITSTRPDTPEEAKFRSVTRLRLKALTAAPTAEDKAKFITMGCDVYKLEDIKSERVVTQECSRWEKLASSLKTYGDSFKDFASDKVITKEEREALTEIATSLSLTADDVAPIEAVYQFKDLTRPAAKPADGKPATAKPDTTKPAVATTPKPAAASPGVTATKPPAATPGTAPAKKQDATTPGVTAPKKQDDTTTKKQGDTATKKQDTPPVKKHGGPMIPR
jgi:hypothetical protein